MKDWKLFWELKNEADFVASVDEGPVARSQTQTAGDPRQATLAFCYTLAPAGPPD